MSIGAEEKKQEKVSPGDRKGRLVIEERSLEEGLVSLQYLKLLRSERDGKGA